MNRVSAPVAPHSRTTASRLTASKYSSNLARALPSSESLNSLVHGLQVHLQTRSITASNFALSWPPSAYLQTRTITASKCIPKLTPLRPPSSHDHGLHVHLPTSSITASKCISKLAWLRPPSSQDHGLQVHLQTCSITASNFALSWPPSAYLQTRSITAPKCIPKLARLWPPSSHNHGFQVHLPTRSITASKCTSKLAQLRPPSSQDHGRHISKLALWRPRSASLSSLNHGVVNQWS